MLYKLYKKRLKSWSLCKNYYSNEGIEPSPPAQVSSIITTTLLRMILAMADHLKRVSTEFVCLHPDMPGFKSKHGSASNITRTKIIYKNNCALTDQSVICHRTLSNVDSCKNYGLKLRIANSFH